MTASLSWRLPVSDILSRQAQANLIRAPNLLHADIEIGHDDGKVKSGDVKVRRRRIDGDIRAQVDGVEPYNLDEEAIDACWAVCEQSVWCGFHG